MKVQKIPRLISLALVRAVFLVTLAIPCLAQITTTGIRGIVRDPSGAVIPGATIKLTDEATGIEQTTVSSSDGGFI
ncbi:MAG TPA: carboxypeptidase-like regulatory domain-containing protein, partial [Blastocatellia bacterium]